MDDFAHLLLGYVLFRFLRVFRVKAGKLELAVILVASILPDLLWAAGLTDYASAHTLTFYLLLSVPFLLFRKTRVAAAGFATASFLHIAIDAFMHERTTVLLAPLSGFSITGTFNYWESWQAIAAYWLAILLLLGISVYLEKKQSGKISALIAA